jgi:ankyrin repeat protein
MSRASGMYDDTFIYYVRQHDYENIQRYIPYVDVNKKDKYRQSSLHYAAINPELRIIELLLNNGALVDIRGPQNRTPLMIACTYDNLDVINKLLDRGADINAIDDIGKTPLMHCIPRSVVILNRLIERGADVNILNNDG